MECRCAIRFLQDSFRSSHGLTSGVQQVFPGPSSPVVGSLRMALKDCIAYSPNTDTAIKVVTTYKKILSSTFKVHLLSSQTNDPIFLPSIHLPTFQSTHPSTHLWIHSFIYHVILLFSHLSQPARSLFACYTARYSVV